MTRLSKSVFNNGFALLLGYLGWGVSGLIGAWILSQYLSLFIAFFKIKFPKSTTFSKSDFKETLIKYKDFPLVNSLHAFTDIFANQFILFWIITGFFGSIELGLFATMFRYIKAPIGLVSSSVSQIFYVDAAEKLKMNKKIMPELKRTVGISLIFAIPFCLVLLLFGETLFEWYLGDEWGMSGIYAKSVLPVLFFTFILSPISSIPILYKKQRTSYLFSLLCYVLGIGGLLLGVSLGWSFENALLLYSAGYLCYYVLILFWYKKLIQQDYAYSD